MQRHSIDIENVAVIIARGIVTALFVAAVAFTALRFGSLWVLAWWLLTPLICPVERVTMDESEKLELAEDIVDVVCETLIEELQKVRNNTESDL